LYDETELTNKKKHTFKTCNRISIPANSPSFSLLTKEIMKKF